MPTKAHFRLLRASRKQLSALSLVIVVTTDEVLVAQCDDDADTLTANFGAMFEDTGVRPTTCSDWPPEPPPPAELEAAIAQGTTPPSARNAGFYMIVRRPTTSGD